MDLNSISFIFNRAISQTFSKKKYLMVFFILAMAGVLVVFFRGLSMHAGQWMQLSLTFLPIFLCAGILLAMGIFLIRLYHDEVKNKDVDYWKMLNRTWEVALAASYFFIPIIISYLLLWILLGAFVLLSEIPVAGAFFNVVLSFAPFLINLSTLILCVTSFLMLFFVAPVIALRGIERRMVIEVIAKRLEKNLFINIILILISLLPLLFVVGLLTLAASLTGYICINCNNYIETTLMWFVIMVPFTALLTPAVIFFFNFAAESHVLLKKTH